MKTLPRRSIVSKHHSVTWLFIAMASTSYAAARPFFLHGVSSPYVYKVHKALTIYSERLRVWFSEGENVYGLSQRRVFANPTSLDVLSRGSKFMFVITTSGEHRYDKVIGGWEVGVKHALSLLLHCVFSSSSRLSVAKLVRSRKVCLRRGMN
jgi:hypothetical protein